MRSIVEANLPIHIAAVISNEPDAAGLAFAQDKGIPTRIVDHRSYATRLEYDRQLIDVIEEYHPGLVVLAGFMRILTPTFVNHFTRRLINIHPSILPSFTGLHTHKRAIESGVKVHGCTVHFVTEELDAGPIVAQAVVPVLSSDNEATLAQRVLKEEHVIYPRVIQWWAQGLLQWRDKHMVVLPSDNAEQTLIAPSLNS
ncbi:MAG: phosphoribosylglycinamide formyltransferase [Betaproteobacteria bacterium]|uniref:phosphoribosylglycinamide formyltransferase n=1 Tax=Ferrovum sp. PN-J185 TaxID=1356306 RepID=UPI0007949C85|nr:phosphoribosylglycinamide formyltransferase [Ferrovum sp. PN-J185]MDE1890914.1 phosphoribosylglycinamide formyltransferase [Betaproteobacteria bacterium]MDE2055774.1 phosphoribosylglycinamide formyltransferase [Betaproteobacteria bacterium]